MNTPADSFLETTYTAQRAWLNNALQTCLHYYHTNQPAIPELNTLWDALNHATVLGGKRIRPLLALETYRMFKATEAIETSYTTLMGICCALEFIHAQSLVFDDLPCMDNDDLRRGQPTVHKAFNEATAVLVGDALACLSFGCLVRYSPHTPPEVLLQCVQELSDISSLHGLVNGQYADIVSEGKPCSPQRLSYIHANKTGALLAFSLRAGALFAAVSAPTLATVTHLGALLGELFQVVDDYLDVAASTTHLGKTAGKDVLQEKATYLSVHGLPATKAHIEWLSHESVNTLRQLQQTLPHIDIQPLLNLVQFLQTRTY